MQEVYNEVLHNPTGNIAYLIFSVFSVISSIVFGITSRERIGGVVILIILSLIPGVQVLMAAFYVIFIIVITFARIYNISNYDFIDLAEYLKRKLKKK